MHLEPGADPTKISNAADHDRRLFLSYRLSSESVIWNPEKMDGS